MGIGGVEKALLGVVNKFVKEGWNVEVALVKKRGEFLNYLPQSVKVTEIAGFNEIKSIIHIPIRINLVKELKKINLAKAFKYSVCLIHSKLSGGSKLLYDNAFKQVPMLNNKTYDLAISFAGPDSFIDTYTDKRIRALEKWGWIHFDVTEFGNDSSIIRNVYQRFSIINIVSEDGKNKFDGKFPQFAHKTCITPNIIDKSSIIRMADENIDLPYERNNINVILTVGRISREKGQYKALQALKILIDHGVSNICWWFVGTGNDLQRCQSYVIENDLTSYVRFLGATVNPYPYFQRAKIYVQPSEHEGFCITLAEAKLFEMPIIATNFTGAREQLKDYSPLHRVTEHSPSNIAIAIEELISLS